MGAGMKPISLNEAIRCGVFTAKEALALEHLQKHLPAFRKDVESQCFYVPYLPSFYQRVETRLEMYCGLQIVGYEVPGMSGRKKYYFKRINEV